MQHDFGHLSVFKKNSWNHAFHQICIGMTKVCYKIFLFNDEKLFLGSKC
jgi:hypothetical protein